MYQWTHWLLPNQSLSNDCHVVASLLTNLCLIKKKKKEEFQENSNKMWLLQVCLPFVYIYHRKLLSEGKKQENQKVMKFDHGSWESFHWLALNMDKPRSNTKYTYPLLDNLELKKEARFWKSWDALK